MAEGLATADGKPIDLSDVDQQFAAAMAAPPADDPEFPAPPEQPPPDPDAPFGYRLDGTPKTRPGGRPPKDKARVQNAPKAITGPGKPGKDGKTPDAQPDYAAGLREFLGGIQLALAVLPFPNDNVRVHARYQSAVIEKTGDGLATGLGTVAEHNAMVRWGVEKLTQGGGAWVFPAAMAIAPFAVSTAMLWKAPVTEQMTEGARRIEEEAMARLKAEMGLDDAEQDQAA
jgi:hypothetical protein